MNTQQKQKHAKQQSQLQASISENKQRKKEIKSTNSSTKSQPPLQKKKGLLSGLFNGGTAPKTVQETLAYRYITKDGICALPGNQFSLTLTFDDINYQLAHNDDKHEIFNNYCKLLSYFDPSISFQLSFVNRFVNKREVTKAIQVSNSISDDGLDLIRQEYNQMLQKQLAKGNNGLVKQKFLTVTIQADSLAEARPKLSTIEKDVLNNFNQLKVKARTLNGKERTELLYNQMHPYGQEKLHFEWGDLIKSGMSTKDLVGPTSFEFKGNRMFKMGNIHAGASYLQILAPKIPDNMLSEFLDLDSAMTISMHIQSMDQLKAIKKVKQTITNVAQMKLAEQKKNVKNGIDMDMLPPDIETYGNEAAKLLHQLDDENERMFLVTFLILNMNRDKAKLVQNIASTSGIAQKHNCSVKPLDMMQEQALVSSLALGKNEIEIQRGLTTSATAVFIPFVTNELFQEGEATYYGINAQSNNMIMANRRNLRNPNGLYLGTPGSGKTFSAKREIMDVQINKNDDVMILDPEGEYTSLVNEVGGEVINISQSSTNYINPFDIHDNYNEDGDPVDLKADFIISMCEVMIGGKYGLDPYQKAIIDRCVRQMYHNYYENPIPENMPVLADLHALIGAQKEEGVHELWVMLEPYVTGSMNVFNNHTNVNVDSRTVSFNIRSLGKQLKSLGMLIVQDFVWSRVSANRDEKKGTYFYIDEFHLLLKDPLIASYFIEIWKRFRKWGGVPTGITQNVTDLLRSPEIGAIFENTDFIYLLNQSSADQAQLSAKLRISPYQMNYVTNSGPGEGLIIYDGIVVPFRDDFPKDTLMYKLMTSKLEEV